MKAVIQRVTKASVSGNDKVICFIIITNLLSFKKQEWKKYWILPYVYKIKTILYCIKLNKTIITYAFSFFFFNDIV